MEIPTVLAEKSPLYTTGTSSLGQTQVPKVQQASPWDFSAGFPGKNVVYDGWLPGLIQMNGIIDLLGAWGSRVWLTSKIPGM